MPSIFLANPLNKTPPLIKLLLGYKLKVNRNMHLLPFDLRQRLENRYNELEPTLVPSVLYHTSPNNENEPTYDKTNKMTVRPAKTQISLGICPV